MNYIKIALPKKPHTKAYSFFKTCLKGSSNITGFKKGLYNQVKVQNYRLDPPYNRRKHRPSHFIFNRGSISKLSKTFGYVNNNQLSFWIAHALKGVYKSYPTISILRETYRCEQPSGTTRSIKLRVGEITSSHAETICLVPHATSLFNTFSPIFNMLQEAKIFVRRTEFFGKLLRNNQSFLTYPGCGVCKKTKFFCTPSQTQTQTQSFFKDKNRPGGVRKIYDFSNRALKNEPSIVGPFYAHTTTISEILISKTKPLLKSRYQNYVLALSIVAKVASRVVSAPSYENGEKLRRPEGEGFVNTNPNTPNEAINRADLEGGKGFSVFFSGRKKKLWFLLKKARLFFLVTMAASQKTTFSQNRTPYNPVTWAHDVQTLPATCGDRAEAREEKKLREAQTQRGSKHRTRVPTKYGGASWYARTASTWLHLVHLSGGAAARSILRLVSLLDGESSYLLWRNMFSKSFIHSKQQLRYSSKTLALTSGFQHLTYLYLLKKKTLTRKDKVFSNGCKVRSLSSKKSFASFSTPSHRLALKKAKLFKFKQGEKGYVSFSPCTRFGRKKQSRGASPRAYACFVKMNHSCFPALISRIKKKRWWLFSLFAHDGTPRKLSVGYAFRNY